MKIRKRSELTLVVAIVVALGGALGLSTLRRSQQADAESPNNAPPVMSDTAKKQVAVVLTPVRSMAFEQRITVAGSVSASRWALVSARVPGTLDGIFVDEGDRVEAGKTELFQTDSLKLTKAVAFAQQDLTVADCSVREKRALMDKAFAGRAQAQSDLIRYQELFKRNAIAAQVVEQQEARYKQVAADVEHTRSLIDLATAQLEQARLNLTIAQKDLTDSLVIAPINGVVSQRMREPGEMAGAGTPVLQIEDLSLLEISVFLPEETYGLIVPGRTKMRARVGGIDLGQRTVIYKSPTVNRKLRTFEVKGLVESPPQGVVPGCLVQVTIVADRREGLGVPTAAIETRAGRSVVFVVDGKRAKMVPVATGRETDGWREITGGLAPGAAVVSMGQFLLDDGTPVTIVEEGGR